MSKYSYSITDNIDEVDNAQEEEGGLPILKMKETGKLYQYRLLPPSPAWNDYFEERGMKPIPFFFFWKHLYEDPKRPGRYIAYPCPRRNALGGKKVECPDCEEFFNLRNSDSAADQERAKDYMARKRVAFCAVNRDDEDAGPQIVELSAPFSTDPSKQKGQPTQWQKLEMLWKTHKKDVVNPGPEGFDVTQLRTGKGRESTTYTFSAEGPCSLTDDEALMEEWIENQPDLPSFIRPPTPVELASKLQIPLPAGVVTQQDPGRQLPAGEETAGDVVDAEFEDEDW